MVWNLASRSAVPKRRETCGTQRRFLRVEGAPSSRRSIYLPLNSDWPELPWLVVTTQGREVTFSIKIYLPEFITRVRK